MAEKKLIADQVTVRPFHKPNKPVSEHLYPAVLMSAARRLMIDIGVHGSFVLQRKQRGPATDNSAGAWELYSVSVNDAGVLSALFSFAGKKPQRYQIQKESGFEDDPQGLARVKVRVGELFPHTVVNVSPISAKGKIATMLPEVQSRLIKWLKKESRKDEHSIGIPLPEVLHELRVLLDKFQLHMGVELNRENTHDFFGYIAAQVEVLTMGRGRAPQVRVRVTAFPEVITPELVMQMHVTGDLGLVMRKLSLSIKEAQKIKDQAQAAEKEKAQIIKKIVELEAVLSKLRAQKFKLNGVIAAGDSTEKDAVKVARADLGRLVKALS